MATIPIRQIQRDPRHNISINPLRNWQIDPLRNWQIDPCRSWQINPLRNWQIDPMRNWHINPMRNWHVNPLRNWHINPLRNWQISPSRNSVVNPFANTDFRGLYIFERNTANCCMFAVKEQTEGVLLLFDSNCQLKLYAVPHSVGYSLFNLNNNYVGYIISNGSQGFNIFTLQGECTHYMI